MPPHTDTPDGDVQVFPRYLATSTGTGDPALDPLLRIGWNLNHDDLNNAFVAAPDHKVRVGYLPEIDDDGLWRVTAYHDAFGSPAWSAWFNDSCPTEFVTAFTTALGEAYQQGPDTYLAGPGTMGRKVPDPLPVITPLLARGWRIDHPHWDAFAVQSPDELATLQYATGDLDPEAELTTRETRWELFAGPPDRPYWYATASTNTPTILLKAVTECISDPAPLPRWRQETHSYVGGKAQLTPIRSPAPSPLDVRTIARRPNTQPATSAPRWSTTSRIATGSRR
ncbi:DUF317 domain-containing protein [Streptomyces sp. NPDC051132]|uniref:DUF317 domain-containing protein n=1 Tax=unclassified Streptomyces TaxID=2593676 RepID=UPI00343C6EC5